MTLRPDIGARYRILDSAGQGTFSSVWRAKDEQLDCVVAVKVLADNHSQNEDLRERFVDEGRKMRKAGHRYIPALYDIGHCKDRRPFMVMEFAAGGDLTNLKDEVGIVLALRVVDMLEGALGAMHHQQLVHRDLKPANILVMDSESRSVGALVLSDLGLAKDLEVGSGLTAGVGTRIFRPPEQRAELTTADYRCDIYSASAVFIWALTGRTPRNPEDWCSLIDTRSKSIRTVIDRGLSTNPEDRQGSIHEWAAEVRHACDPTSNLEQEPTGYVKQERANRNRWRSQALVGIALAGALLIGALWGSSWPNSPYDTRIVIEDGWLIASDSHVTIEGPATLELGETGIYRVTSAPALATLSWMTDSGGSLTASTPLELQSQQTGVATIRLVGLHGDEVIRIDAKVQIGSE